MSENSSTKKAIIALAAFGGVYFLYQKHKQYVIENPSCNAANPCKPIDTNANHDPTQPPPPPTDQGIIANLDNQSSSFPFSAPQAPFPVYHGGGRIVPFF